MDLDQWTGVIDAFYKSGLTLEDRWNETRSQITPHNTYLPFGIDALIRQLQTNSPFKRSQEVQRLDISSFSLDDGIKTVGDLTSFLEANASPSVLVDAVVEGIRNWLEVDAEYAAGTELAGIWNAVNNNNALPFKTFGAPKLVTTFKEHEEFFARCGRAQSLTAVIFTNGSIKAVGDFHNFLLPCA